MALAKVHATGASECLPGEPRFHESLLNLMRAHDTYGVWKGKANDEILAGFVVTKEKRRTIPVIGEPDSKVLWRLDVFYTAVSLAITRLTGLNAVPIVKVSDEGFGRAFITVGRLVVLSRSLRDVHRFGFESLEALADAGEAMVVESLEMIERFPAASAETA